MMPAVNAPSGVRKAAIFLIGVGEQVSAKVLRHLSPEEVRQITAEIAAMDTVGSEQALSVFREFEALTAEGRLVVQGGADCARRLVENAFGAESARQLLPALAPAEGHAGILQNADPHELTILLKDEHPQTIAVVLSNLPPGTSAALMDSLPEEVQSDVALRMASLDRVSAEALQKVTEAIGARVQGVRRASRANGLRALAALLNHLGAERSEAILARMQQENQLLRDSVRAVMFVFDDILSIDKEGIKLLAAKLDRKVLTLALKGTSAQMREHFMECMSERAAAMLAEDMEALGPVRIRDVKEAQNQVIAVVRQLQQEGKLAAGSGGEQYVV